MDTFHFLLHLCPSALSFHGERDIRGGLLNSLVMVSLCTLASHSLWEAAFLNPLGLEQLIPVC